MVNRLRRLGLVAAVVVAAGCSTISVDTDYDTTVDFSTFRTWAWRPDANEGAPSSTTRQSLIDRRVRPAIERHFVANGYDLVDGSEADFHVGYQVGVEGKLYISTWDHGGRRRRGWGGSTTHVTHYKEGALVVAVIDTDDNEIVWQGTARAVVDPSDSPETRDARVDEAVAKILERFPPQAR